MGVSRSQLYRWRQLAQVGNLGSIRIEGFVPALIAPDVPAPVPGPLNPLVGSRRMEVLSANGRRVIVERDIAAAFLAIGPCQRSCGAAGRTRGAASGGGCQCEGDTVEHRGADCAFAIADRQAGAGQIWAEPRTDGASDRLGGIAARRSSWRRPPRMSWPPQRLRSKRSWCVRSSASVRCASHGARASSASGTSLRRRRHVPAAAARGYRSWART